MVCQACIAEKEIYSQCIKGYVKGESGDLRKDPCLEEVRQIKNYHCYMNKCMLK
jgi:hypothetical protein